jgi:serine-type D-Ala-D-Ala carboxypeptidase (penicillin-binding protein 5/6)
MIQRLHMRGMNMLTSASGMTLGFARWSWAILTVAVLAMGWSTPAQAQFTTSARQAFLMDAETGAVLYQKSGDELMPPASMSKLMTLAVLFKAVKEGRVKLDDQWSVSQHAWRTGGGPSATSAMFLPLNGRASVSELIQGLIVQSGNDAAIVVAEAMGKSEAGFAQQMTDYARQIGMTKSTFANATGLPQTDHLMTARELAVLTRHLMMEFPDYYAWFAQKEYRYGRHKFINRNPLLFTNSGFDGLKTGFVNEAGYGIVASAVREDRRLIAVLNGLSTKEERKAETAKLVDWGFKSFAPLKLFDKDEKVGEARVWGGSRIYVPLVGNGDVSVLMPRFTQNKIKFNAEVVYQGPLKPPIKRGDQVAVLRVTSQVGSVSEVPLYAAEDIEKSSVWARGLDSLVHLAFRWVPL